MSYFLYNMLKKVPAPDCRLQRLRSRLHRYLEGPLLALASGLQESAYLHVVDANVSEPCVWWHVKPGAFVGLSSSSLDFLALFRNLPTLPSGPDDFWARLAADRPCAFSRAVACAVEPRASLCTLTCLIQSSDWHIFFYYEPKAEMYESFLPVPSAALGFAFECALSAAFLPIASLTKARCGDVLHTGHPAQDCLWLGRYDMWLPIRYSGKVWKVVGDWDMKPTPSDHFPLEISVELGRIRLRGRDLDALTQGAVLPLGIPVGSEVQLVSDNRVIARAELVVVGGELAVRLLSDVALTGSLLGDFHS